MKHFNISTFTQSLFSVGSNLLRRITIFNICHFNLSCCKTLRSSRSYKSQPLISVNNLFRQQGCDDKVNKVIFHENELWFSSVFHPISNIDCVSGFSRSECASVSKLLLCLPTTKLSQNHFTACQKSALHSMQPPLARQKPFANDC